MILHHTYLEENSPSVLLFPSPVLKKVGEKKKKEQTKVYDHVVTSTHVVKKTGKKLVSRIFRSFFLIDWS